MSAVELVARARAHGIELNAIDDRLRYRPIDALPAALRAELGAHRPAVLALLAMERYTADPRPDLGDSARWRELLTAAYTHDGHDQGGLFGALHGLRCLGASLREGTGGLRLFPGELAADEYRALREVYLVPHRAALVNLLAQAGDECGGNSHADSDRAGQGDRV